MADYANAPWQPQPSDGQALRHATLAHGKMLDFVLMREQAPASRRRLVGAYFDESWSQRLHRRDAQELTWSAKRLDPTVSRREASSSKPLRRTIHAAGSAGDGFIRVDEVMGPALPRLVGLLGG